MEINTLENVSVHQILDCFNEAFSDYLTPMNLTLQQLEHKMRSENVMLEYSVGAFKDGKLIGLILHAYDVIDGQKVLYNAGTGVVPSQRGQALTEQMYSALLPQFKEKEISKIVLEVITANAKAIKVYKKIGFDIVREFYCFRGNVSKRTIDSAVIIKEMENVDWQSIQDFGDCKPAWSSSVQSLARIGKSLVSLGIYESEKLVGYAIYNQTNIRVHQIAVAQAYRNKGYGSALLNYICKNYSPSIYIINVDCSSKLTVDFLEHIGLVSYIRQYEMELVLI